ncbi:VanZ family protein [Bacillus subtilis]|uniref:VanZ family protein n=1 Tax=Bacillus subtilis TaxID=1423 RepID=UPI001B9FB4CE|nr:VanZ family protein [Bacillus subtilis]CAI6330769.1 VanZ-like protein [Bacillus subtilis]
MLLNSFIIPYCIIAYVLFIVYRLFAVLILKKPRYSLEKSIYVFALFVYLTGLICITLFPIPVDSLLIHDRAAEGFQETNNLVPFNTIKDTLTGSSISVSAYQIGGNILLLFPLGCFLPLLFEKMRKAKLVIVSGFVASLIIETSQFTISSVIGLTYRSFDIDDLILNTLGASLGYIFFKSIYPMIRKELFEMDDTANDNKNVHKHV